MSRLPLPCENVVGQAHDWSFWVRPRRRRFAQRRCMTNFVPTVFVGAILFPLLCGVSHAQEPIYYCYGWSGDRIPLTMSTERIGIRFATDVTPVQRASAVALHSDLLEVDENLSTYGVAASGTTVVRVQPGKSTADMEALIDSLKGRPDIAFATPVFQGAPGFDNLLTDTFYASFPDSTPEAEIRQLNARYGVEVIAVKNRSIIGKVGYRLRVTAASPGNALEIANLYFDHPLTINADPTLVPLYSPYLATTPDDTHYGDQWALPEITAPEGWDISTGSSSVIIAIVDSGVDLDHEDLDDKLVAGWDFTNDDDEPEDGTGHGTSVAGIAAAESDNDQGVAGVNWGAKIMPVRAFANLPSEVAEGIDWATDHGAHVINLSLGYRLVQFSNIGDAVERAKASGVVVVAASGRNSASPLFWPAAHPDVIGVMGLSRCDTRVWPDDDDPCMFYQEEWGSQYGITGDVMAPAGDIYTTTWDGGYRHDFGETSAASPHVAGLAALVLSVDSTLTPSQVQAIIQFSADDLVYSDDPGGDGEAETGRDELTGYGRINVEEALKLAQVSPILAVSDSSGAHRFSFDIKGNFILEEDLTESASGAQLTTAAGDLWILRDSFDAVVARVDSAGEMYLKGTFTERVSSPSPTNGILVLKDASANIVAFIDEDGDLELKGGAFIGSDPDRLSSQGN